LLNVAFQWQRPDRARWPHDANEAQQKDEINFTPVMVLNATEHDLST
jgi:hypothetical protein